MKSQARKTPTPRAWSATSNGTYMLTARIPLDLMDRLRRYVDATMYTVTDVVIKALEEYLEKRGA